MREPLAPRTIWRRFLPLIVAAIAALLVVAVREDKDDVGTKLATELQDRVLRQQASSTSTTAAPDADDGGEDDGGGDDGDRGTTAPPAGLARLVLAAGDLPAGWNQITSGEKGSSEVCPGHDPSDEVVPQDLAQVAFQAEGPGGAISNAVAEFSDAGEAAAYVDAIADAIEACGTYKRDGRTYRLARSGSPGVGEESLAADLSATTEAGAIDGRFLVARVGARVATIASVSGDGSDRAVALDALQKVVARL